VLRGHDRALAAQIRHLATEAAHVHCKIGHALAKTFVIMEGLVRYIVQDDRAQFERARKLRMYLLRMDLGFAFCEFMQANGSMAIGSP
jgi:hypothetical protein